jgi:hypothetical protein
MEPMNADEDGTPYVLDRDHVAAVAAARAATQLECRLTPDDWRDAVEQAREQGQRDAENVHQVALAAAFGLGREQGQRDALAGLDNAEVWHRIMKVLDDNGINNEGGLHSWRCFDRERYPEPCACAAEVVVEIIQAIKGDSDG